jgi:hypothetical protein
MAPDFSGLFLTLLFFMAGMVIVSALFGFAMGLHWLLSALGVL